MAPGGWPSRPAAVALTGPARDLREQFRGHPHFERTAEFVERYDNPAFDPEAEALPLAFFEPMLRRLMAQPRQSVYKAAMKPQAF